MTPDHVDVLVLGAGQGGGPLAGAFARAGRRTILVEQAHAGGTCVNVGCTPTKTMVAGARVAYLARRAADYGVAAGPVSVQLEAVRARTRRVVAAFRAGSERALAAAGVELCHGHGHFVGPRTLEVTSAAGDVLRTISADLVIVNTGLRPARPTIAGLDMVTALDSTSVMELDALPAHLLVFGGGYVGLEFAQLYRRLGSAVTVIDVHEQLMPREDADVSAALAEILRDDGIDLRLGHEVVRVAPVGDGGGDGGGVQAELRDRATGHGALVAGSHLLLATGRRPNTDHIGAAAAGIALDARGYVVTDERLATSAEGVYAIGDVKGGPAFTHVAYDDFRILRANLLEGGARTTRGRLVPYTLFTDPQLGRIGRTEAQARADGLDVRVASQPMRHVARAIEMDETRGLMKVVVDAATGRLLGAAVLGVEGGELASVLQMAMVGGLPYPVLRDMVYPHPTFAESLNNLFAQLD
jgi:pyruvate/2-oxoglutarate dehydrogenase complex dihydrolipoamide dehydrogenase (E3) component